MMCLIYKNPLEFAKRTQEIDRLICRFEKPKTEKKREINKKSNNWNMNMNKNKKE
ncbi:unnamed protein product [Paramecium primaurelia]|uniref:Uncharacterized protein n=1 Tax=Paramecium primaurelia TaxID=5886 RepID=A0A8S1L2A2_PARPR|nr:unnamed protein product [Paramecium primaurelia]